MNLTPVEELLLDAHIDPRRGLLTRGIQCFRSVIAAFVFTLVLAKILLVLAFAGLGIFIGGPHAAAGWMGSAVLDSHCSNPCCRWTDESGDRGGGMDRNQAISLRLASYAEVSTSAADQGH